MIYIQIPWNKKYYCQTLFFYFVPKVCHYIEENGMEYEEKNKDAKFKIFRI